MKFQAPAEKGAEDDIFWKNVASILLDLSALQDRSGLIFQIQEATSEIQKYQRPQYDDPQSLDEEFVRRVNVRHLGEENEELEREHLRLQEIANLDLESLSGSDTGMCGDRFFCVFFRFLRVFLAS